MAWKIVDNLSMHGYFESAGISISSFISFRDILPLIMLHVLWHFWGCGLTLKQIEGKISNKLK